MTDSPDPSEAPSAPAPAAAAPGGASQQQFMAALQTSQAWLEQWEAGELSDEVLADRVGELLGSLDGARGFFVVALAGESPLLDRLPEPLLLQLRRGDAAVVDLSARNLAMSTAMALHHGREGDAEQRAASLRVQTRCTELLRQLDPRLVKARLESLLIAARAAGTAGDKPMAGPDDRPFLERWGYDSDQREAIALAIEAVAEG